MKMKTKYIKLIIFIALVIIILILNHNYKLYEKINNLDNFKFMINENIIKASIIYIIITAIGSSVLALPGVTFALFSGILFGPILGIILCSISATMSASTKTQEPTQQTFLRGLLTTDFISSRQVSLLLMQTKMNITSRTGWQQEEMPMMQWLSRWQTLRFLSTMVLSVFAQAILKMCQNC